MKLGVNIPNFGPGTTPQALLDWVRFAEEAGFDAALMSDHVAVTPDVAELYPAPFYEPLTTLAWLAGITERIELGTTVIVLPYRHPLQTARVVAQIDQFSHGRFIFGVGVGMAQAEYAALDVPFGRRGAITDDYLAAIKAHWATDVVSHHGEFASFDAVHTGPRPLRQPHPPIWVGGTSRAAIRRAAEFGDAWHPNNAELEWLRATGLPALRAAAETAGRPVPEFSPRMRVHLAKTELPEDKRRIGEGSLKQVLHDVGEIAAMGASYLVLDTNPDHPSQRQPTAVDQENLRQVVTGISGSIPTFR